MKDVDASRSGFVWLDIEGMSCGACAANVERALRAIPGVECATVDRSARRAAIEGAAPAGRLIAAVQAAGYKARQIDAPASEQAHGRRGGC